MAPNAYPLLVGDENIPLIGGAEVQQVIVARGLASRGYRVSMICLDFGQPTQVDIDGIRVFRSYGPDEGMPILRFIWPRIVKMWACLKRVDADVYYQRTAGTLTGIVAAFCEWTRKKSVFAIAGEPMIRHRRERLLYEYGLRHVTQICVQNAEQARLVRLEYGRDSTLIRNCVHEAHSQSGAARDRVLWISTIRALKRPGLFLDVAEALPQYRFTMVGGPASEDPVLFEAIRERAQKLSNVEFVGFVPYTRIHRYFGSAALLVNTSESEGFPNTFLQAWANGVPTLSFIDCGARMEGRALGEMVFTLEAMTRAVSRLMGDDEARAREGQLCRHYVERYHGFDQVLGDYERMFSEVHSLRPGKLCTAGRAGADF